MFRFQVCQSRQVQNAETEGVTEADRKEQVPSRTTPGSVLRPALPLPEVVLVPSVFSPPLALSFFCSTLTLDPTVLIEFPSHSWSLLYLGEQCPQNIGVHPEPQQVTFVATGFLQIQLSKNEVIVE